MRTTCAVFFTLTFLLVSACTQKVNDPADVQAIKASVAEYVKAVNAGDADAVARLMTDKTIYADLNLPVATGVQAIRAQAQAMFDHFKPEFTAPVEDVRVAGDLAVARGTWTIKLTPNAEGVADLSDGGNWIVTLARQSDGSWKWDWIIPNSNHPLPGSTASGEDEQALYQLERDWAAADPKKDSEAVEKFLASDFVSNFEGRILNKKQFLAMMKSNPAKIESAANSEMRAMVFGDTALVSGVFTEKSTTGGKDTSRQSRYTEVYAKRDGRWQCVTQHVTKM